MRGTARWVLRDIIYAIILWVLVFLAVLTGRFSLIKLLQQKAKSPTGRGRFDLAFLVASLGEAHIAVQLAKALGRKDSNLNFLFLSQNWTGLEFFKKHLEPNDQAWLYPLDFHPLVKKLLRQFQFPKLIILESEYWPNLIELVQERGGQIGVLNARLSPGTFALLRFFRGLVPVQRLDWVCCSSAATAQSFYKMGLPPERLTKIASFKLEMPILADSFLLQQEWQNFYPQEPFGAKESKIVTRTTSASPVCYLSEQTHLFSPEFLKTLSPPYSNPEKPWEKSIIFVSGSIQPEEIPVLLAAWGEYYALPSPKSKTLVLSLRHPAKASVAQQFLSKAGYQKRATPRRGYSVYDGGVLLLAVLGVQTRWYQMASGVFVGGSLVRRGGQNFAEPLALGKPTASGHRVPNFAAEKELLSSSVRWVKDAKDLLAFFRDVENQQAALLESTEAGRSLIQSNLVNWDGIVNFPFFSP